MSKTIETLVGDIHDLLMSDNVEIPDEVFDKFGQQVARMMKSRLSPRDKGEPVLRISNIGKPCERQIWLGIHKHEEAEPLRPETRLKFLYGDLIEEMLLFLVEASGHRVEGRQDKIEVEGVPGSRDAVIDGVLVDVKSASTFSFNKFLDGSIIDDDSFGYIGQIQTYLEGSQDDPLVTDKDRCAFLVMDKTLGHICLNIHEKVTFDVREVTREKVKMVEGPMPERGFDPIPDGYMKDGQLVPNGNLKLGVQCSYCNMKKACYPEIRTFLYGGNKPVHFVKVVKEPKVPEITGETVG